MRLRTGNLDRAIDFYQRVIGLKIPERHSDTVSLSAAESQTAILILTADASAVRRPPARPVFIIWQFATRPDGSWRTV